jgi:hypothetical protein
MKMLEAISWHEAKQSGAAIIMISTEPRFTRKWAVTDVLNLSDIANELMQVNVTVFDVDANTIALRRASP